MCIYAESTTRLTGSLQNPSIMGLQTVSLVLLFSASSSLCWSQRSNPVGDKRSCERCDARLSCNCSCEGFSRVPMVTSNTISLDLSFNNISVVTDDDLRGYTQLKALSLHGNRLTVIQPSAFDSLQNLEELDLSANQLTALSHTWFKTLGMLWRLNLLNNPYSSLGSAPLFEGLIRLRSLQFGGAALEELRRGDLRGVTQLEELTVHANNLRRYDPGTLASIRPLGLVSLSLHHAFLNGVELASAVLSDVCYPETPIVLSDLHLNDTDAIQPLSKITTRGVRHMTFRNVTLTDEAIAEMLVILSGAPLTTLTGDGIKMTGTGRWHTARLTNHRSFDELFFRNVEVINIFSFESLHFLVFLLPFPRKLSIINSKVFEIPCETSKLLLNLQYLDLTENQLTDLSLENALCGDDNTLHELRVFNISRNILKSLSNVNRLVAKLFKLTHLDISRNNYASMPQKCSWPPMLRYLNISSAKLSTITPCLPTTLEVLDLSNNDLQVFPLELPVLTELHLSGNKFLRLPPGHLFPNLQTLTIQSNNLNLFGHSDLQSYQQLENLQAGRNAFVCSCDFVSFFRSDIKGGVGVHLTDDLESYICDSPLHLQGVQVGQVHLSIVDCHYPLFVSVSCGLALVIGILLGVLLWRLHAFWYLKMTWAWLKAKRSSSLRQRRRDGGEVSISFDAFVSYSERDACWVEDFLVPELEQPNGDDGDAEDPELSRPLSLCLHKRDFRPGHWIVDNIMSAMERSRRTVFILSENFVRSDWCRYELDFSHFWIFDSNADVDAAILVLLEPLSKDDIPKRFCKLRKLMSSTTYLEWPREEERRGEFWRSLRKALR